MFADMTPEELQAMTNGVLSEEDDSPLVGASPTLSKYYDTSRLPKSRNWKSKQTNVR